MTEESPRYMWHKQRLSKDSETIDCPPYDPIKDFKRDPTGCYVLIKVDMEKPALEVAICSKDHEILKIFRGQKCQDLYDTIFTYEKRNKLRWFEEKTHIAYLGKELKKAEIALDTQGPYIQE